MSGSTNFPGSLDSHTGASPLGFGEVTNQAAALTTTAHTNSVTTITVDSTSGFPSKGYILIKREIISYTGTTATTFTGCTRAADGTTADAYLTGTKVEHVVVAANHNDLAAGLVAVETAMGARLAYLTRKNRVINGCMRVKQRTTLGTTDDSYTLDRWNLLIEDTAAWAVTQETSDVPTDGSKYALKLTADGTDDKGGVATYLEYRDVADLRGKTVSLQAKLKVSNARIGDVRMAVLEWTGTADSVTSDVVSSWGSAGTNPTLAASWAYLGTPSNLSVTTSWATYRLEGLTVGASANNLAVFIWVDDESNDSGDHLLITDVQLEEGPTCSGIERRLIAQERHLCRRYYRELGTATIGVFTSSTVWGFAVTFEQEMRASPTAAFLVTTMVVTEPGVAVRTGTSAGYVGAAGSAVGWAGTISGTGFSGTTNAMAFANTNPFLSLDGEM